MDGVIRRAHKSGESDAMSMLLASIRDPARQIKLYRNCSSRLNERGLSISVLQGLLVLSRFPADGGSVRLADLGRLIDMEGSTTHRYVATLVAAGLLEQDPATREYCVVDPG